MLPFLCSKPSLVSDLWLPQRYLVIGQMMVSLFDLLNMMSDNIGFISDWLFQGFPSLCFDWSNWIQTSILLAGFEVLEENAVSWHNLCVRLRASLSILSRMEWLCIPSHMILTLSYFPGWFSHLSPYFLSMVLSTKRFFVWKFCGRANKHYYI